ncbi:hypothetical protein AB4037_33885 [Labrys sp. KB_33_2]|uniref:hypothetical protein n=1 Tax=Labrys sp. KB_33_2 TaxID=3237479 RepID=UPI003F9078C8
MTVSQASPSTGPDHLQQVLAWLLLIALVSLFLFVLVSGLLNWRETTSQIEILTEKIATLETRREDPTPLTAALARIKQVPLASLGYVEGTTEEEARIGLEQSVSALLSTGQMQILSFRRQSPISYGSIRGLRFEAQLIANSRSLPSFLTALAQARPMLFLRQFSAERRQDGSLLVGMQVEAYWAGAK